MSYEIAILNPRGRSKKRRAKKRRTSGAAKVKRNRKGQFVKGAGRRIRRRKARRSNPRKKKSAARRPAAGYVVGNKPIRRRKLNPRRRRHHARRRRSNPRFSVSGITNQLMPAFYGAAGGIALDVALGYVPLPDMLKTGYAKHATKIAGALGIGILARKFLRGKGSAVAAGALTVAVYGLLKDVAIRFAPQVKGLGDYEEVTIDNTADQIGAYINGYLPDGSSSPMGAYISGTDPADDGAAGGLLTGMEY